MIVQGSPEWFAARCGSVTASRVSDVIAKTKSGPAASRANYAAQLVQERLTGLVEEGYTNAAMQHGIDTEPEARRTYEFLTNSKVQEASFVLHPTIGDTGASPDGFVGDEGLIEIKCPNTVTHIETLRNGTIAGKYVTQMQWQMACTGRRWCDFVSYDPRMPAWASIFIQRVDRDPEAIASLEREVVAFLAEVRATVEDIRRKYGPNETIPAAAELLMAG